MKEFIRVLKFTFFSISAGLIEMGAFALLNEFTALPYWPCYLIALCLRDRKSTRLNSSH